MKTSTLLVLLGVSIIAIAVTTFASFILSTGVVGASIAPAGSAVLVAVLVGFGQILIGKALRPATPETEKATKKEKVRNLRPPLPRARTKMEEEEPRIIAVDNQEPDAWLKNTLEKLAEQSLEQGEESVTPAESPGEAMIPSKPRAEDRAKPASASPLKVRGSLVQLPSEVSRLSVKKEPFADLEAKSQSEAVPVAESQPEPITRPVLETPPEPVPSQQDEDKPGVRRLKEMEITFVERDGITFLEVGTGIHERYPCEDQSLIDYAWRALVRGLRVNVEIENGRVTKLTSAS